MNFISLWQYLSSDLQALPPGHSLAQGTFVCQFKITFMQMYPNWLYCNLAWVQQAVELTWTAQTVWGDWASLQSVWGWLPTATVPARKFKTSRGISIQPVTLEVTVILERPWAVKQPITNLQAAEVETKQASSSLCILLSDIFRLELEFCLCFAKMLSWLLCFGSMHLPCMVWNGEMWMTQVYT